MTTHVAKKSSGSESRVSFSRSGSGMKPNTRVLEDVVRAMEGCGGAKASAVSAMARQTTMRAEHVANMEDFISSNYNDDDENDVVKSIEGLDYLMTDGSGAWDRMILCDMGRRSATSKHHHWSSSSGSF